MLPRDILNYLAQLMI